LSVSQLFVVPPQQSNFLSHRVQSDETADGGEVVDYTLGDEELAYLCAAVGDTFGHTLGDEELLNNDMYEDFSDSELSRNDEFAHWHWLEQIDGDASVGGNLVAVCDAKLIRRAHIRRTFWSEMAEPSEETSDLGFELFDRYGRLSREHYDHKIGKGSGAWGEELNHGDMLLFESLHVERSRRHQGIGTKIVNAILDKVRAKSDNFFAFVGPGYLTRDMVGEGDRKEYSEMAEELSTISLRFWRSLGFRRVGTSSWLAFTDNDSHPSRRLTAGEDWDPLEQSKEKEPLPEAIQTVFNTLSYPSASDAECVRQIQEAFPGEEGAAPHSYTDKDGNTILHSAADGRKAETIAWLRAKHPSLTDVRNAWGHTPLEALQSSLEKHRTRRRAGMPISVALDRFEGFSQPDIASLAALTGTEIFDLTKLSDQDISAVSSAADDAVSRVPKITTIRHTLRLKYGCTCGECIGGFLSPRMHFALLCQAEHRHDLLTADLDAKGPAWVASHGLELDHLALPVRENLNTNKSMRQGFTRMCGHIARCLREKRVPDEEAVLESFRNQRSEWPPVTKNYLQRGGTVAAVATMLFDRAMRWDEWAGDGIHLDAHGGHVKTLPVCRNDREFGFVSGMCGYKRVSMIQHVDMFGRERVY